LKVIIDSLTDLIITISTDSVLGSWKPWHALDLILKSVPTPVYEDFLTFQTLVLSRLLESITRKLNNRKSLFSDSKMLLNLSKFIEMMVDRAYAGRKSLIFFVRSTLMNVS
jgi:hypothetical protein